MKLVRVLGGVIIGILSLLTFNPGAFAAATGKATCTEWSFNAASVIEQVQIRVDDHAPRGDTRGMYIFNDDGLPHIASGTWDLGPGEHHIVMRDWDSGDLSKEYHGADKQPDGSVFLDIWVKCPPVETTTTVADTTTTSIVETTTTVADTTTTIPETTTTPATTTSTLPETTTSTIANTTTSNAPTSTTEASTTTVEAYPSTTAVIEPTTTVAPSTTLETSTVAPNTTAAYRGIDITNQELAATGIEVWKLLVLGVVLVSLGVVAYFASADRKEVE